MAPNRTAYGSQGFFGFFGSNNGTGNSGDNSNTSPLLDLSDFPSLSRGGSQGGESIAPSPLTRKQPYVGMVKQPTNEQTEFQMSAEDFPALPGLCNFIEPCVSYLETHIKQGFNSVLQL